MYLYLFCSRNPTEYVFVLTRQAYISHHTVTKFLFIPTVAFFVASADSVADIPVSGLDIAQEH